MTWPIIATFSVLILAVVAFIHGKIPLPVVAFGSAILLWLCYTISFQDALSGLSDPTVVFIAALFLLSEGLEASGVTTWIGQWLTTRAGDRKLTAVILVMVLVAVLTALISLNGAVAALLPVGVIIAIRAHIAPSRVLLPMAFASHAGSLLALTGTPVNVIVSDFARQATGSDFGFFSFAVAGIPLLIITILVMIFWGRRLIPERSPAKLPRDLSTHTQVLRANYFASGARQESLVSAEEGVTEFVVAPRSSYIGREVSVGIRVGGGVILGMRRSDDLINEPIHLRSGDTLLVSASWSDLDELSADPGLIPVDEPQMLRQQTAPLGRRGVLALIILAVTVGLLISGIVPAAAAALIGGGAMVVSGVLRMDRALKAISWTTVLLIAGMIPLSTAFQKTGAADLVAHWIRLLVGQGNPYLALLIVSLATLILGQLISNAATVLVVAPIALSLASDLHLSPLPFLMALAITGAAAFLTPVATPVNTMIMGPAGLKFGDYWRFGLPLFIAYLAAAVLLVPVFWPF